MNSDDVPYLIVELDPTDWIEQIDQVLKSAYQLEAELLGVNDFPPLRRASDDLAKCGNRFIACVSGRSVCGVVELERSRDGAGELTTIASLGVHPAHLRAGIGRALVRFVLDEVRDRVYVTTGEKNRPAIRLYESLGFDLVRRFETPDGIAMVGYQHGGPGDGKSREVSGP